jgi:agmatinase
MALHKDLEQVSVFDYADLECVMGDVTTAHNQIYEFTKQVVSDNKTPCMIGGEHSCTYPAYQAVREKFDDVMMIQLDAHADMREDYLSLKASHASVMYRLFEKDTDNLRQIGIRSATQVEHQLMLEHKTLLKDDENSLQLFVDGLKNRPIYISVDLDVLDPSVLPGTGTPEPDGFSFNHLMSLLKVLFKGNVVGMDIMECAPDYDSSKVSSVVGAKVVREMLLMHGGNNGK